MASPSVSEIEVVREDPNPATVLLKVECSQDMVKRGVGKAYKQLAKSVRIPGFRQGKAPRHMLEKMVSPDQLNQEVASVLVTDAFKKALKQSEIPESEMHPFVRPSIDLGEMSVEELKCSFEAKVPLKSKVELGDVQKLSVEKPGVNVTDEEVEQQIEQLRASRGERIEVQDRGVQQGDTAVVNIKFEGEEGEGRTFMTVAGQTFPQLDQALYGMKPDDHKSLELTFPDTFQEADWAGKTETSHVTVRSISSIQLPDLTDEFVKGLDAGVEDVEALKTVIRERIEEAKQRASDETVDSRLLDLLVADSEVQVADNVWEYAADRRLQELGEELKQQNRTLEDLAKENGMDQEQLVEAHRQEAQTYVRRLEVVEALFARENMEVTEEDFQSTIPQIAAENGVQPDQFADFVTKNRDAIRNAVIQRTKYRKTLEYLRENAEILDAKTDEA